MEGWNGIYVGKKGEEEMETEAVTEGDVSSIS